MDASGSLEASRRVKQVYYLLHNRYHELHIPTGSPANRSMSHGSKAEAQVAAVHTMDLHVSWMLSIRKPQCPSPGVVLGSDGSWACSWTGCSSLPASSSLASWIKCMIWCSHCCWFLAAPLFLSEWLHGFLCLVGFWCHLCWLLHVWNFLKSFLFNCFPTHSAPGYWTYSRPRTEGQVGDVGCHLGGRGQ